VRFAVYRSALGRCHPPIPGLRPAPASSMSAIPAAASLWPAAEHDFDGAVGERCA
jgi:hypothetical protein